MVSSGAVVARAGRSQAAVSTLRHVPVRQVCAAVGWVTRCVRSTRGGRSPHAGGRSVCSETDGGLDDTHSERRRRDVAAHARHRGRGRDSVLRRVGCGLRDRRGRPRPVSPETSVGPGGAARDVRPTPRSPDVAPGGAGLIALRGRVRAAAQYGVGQPVTTGVVTLWKLLSSRWCAVIVVLSHNPMALSCTQLSRITMCAGTAEKIARPVVWKSVGPGGPSKPSPPTLFIPRSL